MPRFLKTAAPSRITLADRARDLGQWEIASCYYRDALDRNPQNPPIWVQYGHVLKEAGHCSHAEKAYRTAIAYDPRSADSHLQLGNLLKLQGKIEDAKTAYVRAFALDPSATLVLDQLRSLGWCATETAELMALARTDEVKFSSTPHSGRPGPVASKAANDSGEDPHIAAPHACARCDDRPVDRRQLLTAGIEPQSQKGLEFGALNNPTIDPRDCDVRFVDFTDSANLRQKHRADPERVSGIVEVTYVWPGSGSLAAVIGTGELFDWAIASHVIEHVPNMLGWLRGIAEVLRPGAVFNLAIPDCRFTFDVDCPRSTIGMVLEADLLQYSYPSIRQVFDYCFHAKAIEPGAIWQSDMDVNELPAFVGEIAPQLAFDHARNILTKGEYIDSHCWILTPLSFVGIIEGLSIMGILPPLIPSAFKSTEIGGFEFFCSFTRADATIAPDSLKREQLMNLTRIRSEIERDVRLGRLLAGS